MSLLDYNLRPELERLEKLNKTSASIDERISGLISFIGILLSEIDSLSDEVSRLEQRVSFLEM